MPGPQRAIHSVTHDVDEAILLADRVVMMTNGPQATIGKITTQELKQRGYDRHLSIGSLAGAGSLGLLIPPSIVMIVYGVQAEVSISRLFMAGVVPGLLIAVLYSAYIALRAVRSPALAPKQVAAECGFSSVDTLRRAFLRVVGVTPADYRKHLAGIMTRRALFGAIQHSDAEGKAR